MVVNMGFWASYSLFLIKSITIVIAILLLITGILALIQKGKSSGKNKLEIKKINEKFNEYKHQLHETVLNKDELKKISKDEKAVEKTEKKSKTTKKKLYLINFIGDMRASAVNSLREEISAILTVATPNDEVVLCLESPGGIVSSYGFAAAQLTRLRQKNIPLTVIVDKVAASGGYMMAVVANKIIAAPFAIIGSVGVVAQIPNFHRLLNKNHIDFELITAGEYKRTLTMFGENTEKGREKMQEDIEKILYYFKDFIAQNRPSVNVQQIATGEIWLASEALTMNLIDRLDTSDDYILTASKDCDIYQVCYTQKKSLAEKFSFSVSAAFEDIVRLFKKEVPAQNIEYHS